MLLEDTAIKFKSQYKNLIVPFNENQLQPCSYDLTLDKDLLTFEFASNSCPPDAFITAYDKQVHGIDYQSIDLSTLKDEIYVLQPNQFIIASTQETVNMPDDIAGRPRESLLSVVLDSPPMLRQVSLTLVSQVRSHSK